MELTILPADRQGRLNEADFEAAIRKNTRAIVCTHGSNLTGNLVDIGRVGQIARRHGLLLVVDASQTAGVFPIDVQEMQIDILCFTGHKSLLGPQGTGGLYVREGVEVRPLLSGGQRCPDLSAASSAPDAHRAGSGYPERPRHCRPFGRGAVSSNHRAGCHPETELDLMWAFYRQVSAIPGVTVYGDFSPGGCAAPLWL